VIDLVLAPMAAPFLHAYPRIDFEIVGDSSFVDIVATARRAALDGVGFWPTFEGYVREDVRSGALVSVLDDWCTPFPGPFCITQAAARRRRRWAHLLRSSRKREL
jgi:DNA-binding transcriptional LysR family regulator